MLIFFSLLRLIVLRFVNHLHGNVRITTAFLKDGDVILMTIVEITLMKRDALIKSVKLANFSMLIFLSCHTFEIIF